MNCLNKRLVPVLLLLASMANGQAPEFTAVYFPTNADYISTPWNPDFGANQDFSIEFAMRSNGWSGDPAIVSDKDWDSGSNPGFNIALAGNGKGIDVNVGDGANRADLESGTVNDGQWHHILVTFDRDGLLSLYIDGLLEQSTPLNNVGDINSPYNFKIGQDGTGNYPNAATCDVVNLRVWNRAMAIEDLAGVTCTFVDASFPYILNLLHYWPMAEGQGTTVADEIFADNGIFVGSPQWTSGNVPVLQVNYDYSVAASVVTFNNLCVDAVWYRWDFGDGNTSSQANPSHTYLNPGTYNVKLIAANGCEKDSLVQTVTIVNVGQVNPFNAADLCSTSRLDYIATGFDPDFGADKDFTVEFRVRSFGWDGDPAIVSDKDWDSGGNPGFVIAFNNNSIKVNIGDGANRQDINGARPMDDGQWHHVMASFDRDGEMRLYFDGQLEGARQLSTIADINSPFSLNIGQDGTGNYSQSYSLNGCTAEIAEVRVWSAALSPAETVLCDSLDSSHPLWGQLLHYWRLNEGTGAFAADSKGGADGFWLNTAAWTSQNLFPPAGAQFQENALLSTVEFVNQSTPGSYFWDFGDGNTSTEANPTHTYLATGAFDVTLVVFSTCDADTLVKTVNVSELSTNLLNSLDLDGQNDFVQLNNDLNFGTAADFTLELFVRSSGWSSDPAILSNKDWDSGKNAGFVVAGKSDGANWKFNIGDGANRIDIDGQAINDNKWHHLAVSFDRDGAKRLYQDGALVGENTAPFTGDVNSALALAIGQDGTTSYGAFFSGQVAEVRIWNAALDSVTIAENICSVNAGHPNFANLLHYWKADEGQGTTVSDSKGANNGVYNGDWAVSLNDLTACANQVPLNQTGSGNALDFDGFDDHLSVPKNDLFEIQQNITVEGWVKARTLQQWESFVNYVQDNGSNESGFDFAYVDGKLRFRLTTVTMGGNDWNDNPGYDIPLNEWVHVAGTYDGAVIKMYVNGVLREQENKTGAIDWAFKPLELRIGGYVDDNELYYWDGAVDELRIWTVARTEDEIRQTMCRRLQGNESGLLTCYRFDERTGTQVFDLSPNGFDGEMMNMVAAQDRIVSGAGIGDTSVFVYNADMSGVDLSIGQAGLGSLQVNGINAGAAGVQVYRVDGAPLNSSALTQVPGNTLYFGIVPGSLSSVTYNATYSYTGNSAAETIENQLFMATRKNGEGQLWTNAIATLNAGANALVKNQLSARKEIVLGVADPGACPFIDTFAQTAASFESATLDWPNIGGFGVNLEWGPVGFELGSGTADSAATAPYVVNGLSANQQYEIYLQNRCAGGALSTWVGPFAFSSAQCLPPAALNVTVNGTSVTFSWQSSGNATDYTIEWGPAGFPLGLGVQIQGVDTNAYTLNNLPPNSAFDYYVRSTCGTAGQSSWVGPFNFMTGTSGTFDPNAAATLLVYPNPASDVAFVEMPGFVGQDASLTLLGADGRTILPVNGASAVNGRMRLDLSGIPAGVYTLKVVSNNRESSVLLVKH